MPELIVGNVAPDFMLPCNSGDNIILKDLRGKIVILYFYPKDDTPGCTQEAKDFRDNYVEIIKLNAVVVGVSRDSIDRHDDFKKKYDLPFNLVADEDSILVNDYGVLVEKNMYGKKYMGVERATFLIDESGVIRKIWHKVKVNGHVDEVLEAVRELRKK